MEKRNILFAGAILACQLLAAQTPYMNENYMMADLNGNARYVGMGGASGALGADMSAVSSNPASSGLFRRSDISMAFSVLTQGNKPDLNADMTHMSFDQLGFIYSTPIRGDKLKYLNIGINYQKKANFNQSFIADHSNTNGLSQTMQMADLLNYTPYSTPLADLMYNAYLVNPVRYEQDNAGNLVLDENGNPIAAEYDGFEASSNQYDRTVEGSIWSYDFNMSVNLQDRFYLGLTFGVDNVDYYDYSTYREYFTTDEGTAELYSLYNTKKVDGYGLNVKLGAIVRPFENSPFRIGLAIESPTVYRLDYSSTYSIESPMGEDENGEPIYVGKFKNYLPDYDLSTLSMKITTPWKVRVSLGHTIDKYLAIGAEYEYANYSKTKQAYHEWDYDYYYDEWYSSNTTRDPDMNNMHKATLKGVHSFKLGMELNVTDNIAVRAGYNYYSSMFKKEATLDQTGDSPAFGYQTTTDYMNKGDVNIFTAGLGYRGKHLYVDLAYKYRMQSGDFYAFDDTYIATNATGRLTPVNVDMNTHQVFCSIGYKF